MIYVEILIENERKVVWAGVTFWLICWLNADCAEFDAENVAAEAHHEKISFISRSNHDHDVAISIASHDHHGRVDDVLLDPPSLTRQVSHVAGHVKHCKQQPATQWS